MAWLPWVLWAAAERGAESRASVCGSDDPRRHLQPLTELAGRGWSAAPAERQRAG